MTMADAMEAGLHDGCPWHLNARHMVLCTSTTKKSKEKTKVQKDPPENKKRKEGKKVDRRGNKTREQRTTERTNERNQHQTCTKKIKIGAEKASKADVKIVR